MNGLTPEKIANDEEYKNKTFEIPIYQRLFEWDEERIEQLLEDLFSSFNKDKNKPYYIGMLTATCDENNLVDGQQRFTVLILLAICLRDYYIDWQSFLLVNNKPRLKFAARPNDISYLTSVINKKELDNNICNKKMELGLNIIKRWIDKNNKKEDFAEYVFKKTTFFISKLPSSYYGKDLNKYFETMNSAGKNLENHEILKISCLKRLDTTNNLSKDDATKIWNNINQMHRQIIQKKKEEDKSYSDIYINAINEINNDNLSYSFKYFLNSEINKEDKDFFHTIRSIEMKNEKPKPIPRGSRYRLILSFSEYLLQILYIQLKNSQIKIDDFFDVQKLLETFSTYTEEWNQNNWYIFFKNLLTYRLILEYFVIFVPTDEDSPLILGFSEKTDDDQNGDDNNTKKKLMQYQSMLYSNSSAKSIYLWLNPYLTYIDECIRRNEDFTYSKLLKKLKTIDNNRNILPNINDLSYNNSPLYWFRRLDYYIWEKNCDKKDDDKDQIIDNFRFRRGGRSIEHLYPQNDNNQLNKWTNPENIHRFGNLALISSSFNSTQGNDSVAVKFARVKNQIDKKQLESIKLYKMYFDALENEKNWTEELMEKHENEMYEILKNSFTI